MFTPATGYHPGLPVSRSAEPIWRLF